jgi:hypothetical protein
MHVVVMAPALRILELSPVMFGLSAKFAVPGYVSFYPGLSVSYSLLTFSILICRSSLRNSGCKKESRSKSANEYETAYEFTG